MRYWILRAIFFVAAWLAGILALSLTNVNQVVGMAIAVVWGFACIAVVSEVPFFGSNDNERSAAVPKFFRPVFAVGAVLLALVGSVYAIRAYKWLTWDPIGAVTDNGWGWYGCEKTEVAAIPNGNGVVARIRRTECPGFLAGDTELSYFVFVGAERGAAGARNLVFRYEVMSEAWESPPKITWIGDTSVKIAVGRGAILRVTKQRTSSDGVAISYALAPALLPPGTEYWQRPFW